VTRGRPSDQFFDRFRSAMARLPAGLVRVGPPATPAELARAEKALGRAVPEVYASFLLSFDGADLFHEAVIVAGVGAGAFRALSELPQERPDELVFAEALSGDRFALDATGRVLRYDEGAEERALAGSDFVAWLVATVAREQLLFGPDGEYAPDVFDPEAQEILPQIALRQAERALKADPGSADAEHARGLALAHLGRARDAEAALARAAELFPENPWPWFDLGRTALTHGQGRTALTAFLRAAGAEAGLAGARFFAWAARAALADGERDEAARLRAEALARDPGLKDSLQRAADAAATEGDQAAMAEAVALLEAVAPGASPRRRLPVIMTDAPVREPDAPPRRPAPPPRPRPAARRRPGGSRPGRSR
jgi:tetratricopeptide (TPR) repeat protein